MIWKGAVKWNQNIKETMYIKLINVFRNCDCRKTLQSHYMGKSFFLFYEVFSHWQYDTQNVIQSNLYTCCTVGKTEYI